MPGDKEEIPPPFLCNLTKTLMEDPVVTECGHYFNRASIVEHLKENENCPKEGCGFALRNRPLSTAYYIKSSIEQYQRDLEEAKNAKKESKGKKGKKKK
eukprot:tig00000808_g4399.t1